MGILYFIIALSILVAIHEFGHFICAKLFNVYVYEFSLFMGPKLLQVKRGETKYTLRLLPIGGYCSMAGEQDLQAERNEQEIQNQKDNPKAEEIEELPEIPPERTLSGIAAWKKLIVSSAGAIMNIVLCYLLLVVYFAIGGVAHEDTRVINVLNNSLFSEAGIESGDKILSGSTVLTVTLLEDNSSKSYEATLDFVNLDSIGELDNLVVSDMREELVNEDAADKFGIFKTITQTTTFTIEDPEGNVEQVPVVRDYDIKLNNGVTEVTYQNWGIMAGTRKGTFGEILSASWDQGVYYAGAIFQFLFVDLWTDKEAVEGVTGIVGIAAYSNDLIQYGGFVEFINFVAYISVNLGIMNLLPLPALDGGRNILTIYEMISRKKVNPKVEGIINMVGFVLLMVLMVVITISDIIKL